MNSLRGVYERIRRGIPTCTSGLVVCCCLVLALEVLAPVAAHAYIDPGSGSFILQGVIAAILGAGVTLKVFWNRLFRRGGKSDDQDNEDNDE